MTQPTLPPPASTPPAATAAAPSIEPDRPNARPLLVATDHSALGANAVAVAAALAAAGGQDVRVLHVVDTRAMPLPATVGMGVGLADALLGPDAHAEQEREVRAGIARALGREVDWPVRITLGTPAAAITEEAERVHAALVVLGLQTHGRLARLTQDETAIHVARAATRPVLAATAALRGVPSHVVAAVDFSRASLGAARAALALLGGGGALTLAYAPPLPLYNVEDGEHRVHELGVEAAFAWMEGELAAPPTVRIDRAVLRGQQPCPVAPLLLAHVEQAGADLLALGSGRYGRVERMVLGSVTADVLRDGRVSVLSVPPDTAAPPAGA